MSALPCASCGHMLQFEARTCATCGHAVGFDPDGGVFCQSTPGQPAWLCANGRSRLRSCDNARLGACNWLHPADDGHRLCRSCRHNRIIPDLSVPGVLARWQRIEEAKRRMISGLLRTGLPLDPPSSPNALLFDLLYDPASERGFQPTITTGHQGGVITLNLIEADDAARERERTRHGEPYRTLVGHFRHEVAHYYWHRLVEWTPDLWPFRTLFGDERANYVAALRDHYARPVSPDWSERFISPYAAAHPWEDFAETFAHYLHIVDTLATLRDVRAHVARPSEPPVTMEHDPYCADTATLVERWIPFASSLNAVNRSMGQPDLYPFSLAPQFVLKLDFINRLIAFAAGRWSPGAAEGADLRALAATFLPGLDERA